ncbi:hypothetical protein XENOCAPTIV_023973 [Xenoophorus captivus]|uniref:C2H2-type domain-containing protein n=1 Tax=Xenoophorus captivus TaxID=1517983 RepID=A0ABV0S063_9TELE
MLFELQNEGRAASACCFPHRRDASQGTACSLQIQLKPGYIKNMVYIMVVFFFKCSTCNEQFMYKKNLTMHLMKVHGHPKPHAVSTDQRFHCFIGVSKPMAVISHLKPEYFGSGWNSMIE